MKLTDVEFWEDYWHNLQLPSKVNLEHSFDRCLANALSAQLSETVGTIFEIGCAPGKWLAYLAQECNLRPSGIEYSELGVRATRENFNLLNVQFDEIFDGDFFSLKPTHQFNVVMSLGFIEHFDDVDEVVRLHLQWLKPGGILILGVPNFAGITKLFQRVLDNSLLDKHNLKIMNLDYFDGLSERLNLDRLYIDYIGSFEPDLPISKYKYGNLLQILVKIIIYLARILRKNKIFDRLNNKLFSSYIIAVYRKREI